MANEVLGVECVQSEFSKIVITTWLDFDKSIYVREFESEEERIRKQPLFYNTGVRYKKKPFNKEMDNGRDQIYIYIYIYIYHKC